MNLNTSLSPLSPVSVITDLAVEVTESMCVLSLRPAVRALPSRQMFEHMLKRHNVLFVYVGGESPLKVSTTYRLFSVAVSQAAAAAERATVLKLSMNCCRQERLVFCARLK